MSSTSADPVSPASLDPVVEPVVPLNVDNVAEGVEAGSLADEPATTSSTSKTKKVLSAILGTVGAGALMGI